MSAPARTPTEEERTLVERARTARSRAWCPYSEYPVGAALLGQSGAVHVGANVENASYGLTICAERVAIVHAVTAGERRVTAIAVVTRTGAAPCGACRQVLREFADPASCRVLIASEEGAVRVHTLEELLPESFGPEDLA
jgi:cytidine deaminase